MSSDCLEFVERCYPYPLDSYWKIMIELWCDAGIPRWVIAAVAMTMIFKTGNRVTCAATAHETAMSKKLMSAIWHAKGNAREVEEQALKVYFEPLNFDRWQRVLVKVGLMGVQVDENFYAALFANFLTNCLQTDEDVDKFARGYFLKVVVNSDLQP